MAWSHALRPMNISIGLTFASQTRKLPGHGPVGTFHGYLRESIIFNPTFSLDSAVEHLSPRVTTQSDVSIFRTRVDFEDTLPIFFGKNDVRDDVIGQYLIPH